MRVNARLARSALQSLALLTVLSLAPRVLAGESEELARAREQFEQGLSMESAGNWADALAKFREVAKVRSTPAVRFHIARCLENLGSWNEALGAYELAMAEAEGRTKDEIVQLATEASTRLRRRIPTLRLVHAPGAEAVRVKLDGVDIGAAAFASPLPLDPGGHELLLRDGDRVARHLIKLEPEQKQSFRVERLRAAPDPAPLPQKGGRETPAPAERSVGPWLMMGGGAAGVVAAGVFWGLAAGKKGELEAACYTADRCPRSAEPIHAAGERYTLLTNFTGAVGLVALAAGASWWLLQPPTPKKAQREQLELQVGTGGASIRARF